MIPVLDSEYIASAAEKRETPASKTNKHDDDKTPRVLVLRVSVENSPEHSIIIPVQALRMNPRGSLMQGGSAGEGVGWA